MNLLITNAQEFQSYTILRCLRAQAGKVIITEGGDSVGSSGFRGMAPYSRHIDGRYLVPRFADDWLAGRIQTRNTEAEETYIRRIEEICEREAIDVIMPSLDPEMYVFAKNKERLQAKGILAVVCELDRLLIPMDKARTIQAAQQVGFPCPTTFFPEGESDIDRIVADTEAPWVVKPRFTAHGENIRMVKDPDALKQVFAELNASGERPLVQDFIPGGGRRNFYVTLDRDSSILSVLSPEVIRTYTGPFRVATKSCISSSKGPLMNELRALVRELGLWGGFTIQTKIDSRDGVPKLLEINPRFGNHLWYRTELDVNEPLICLQLARGETPTGNLTFPDGVMMLDASWDFFYLIDNCLYAVTNLYRAEKRGKNRIRSRDILRDYFNRKPKRFCPEVRYLFNDPSPCLRVHFNSFKKTLRAWAPYRLKRAIQIIRARLGKDQALEQN